MATPSKAPAKSTQKPQNGKTETPQKAETQQKAEKPTPKYMEQQANRKRFAFGPVWTAAVMDGKVKDKIKLAAHGEFLGQGAAKDLMNIEMPKLIEKVQKAIIAESKKQH